MPNRTDPVTFARAGEPLVDACVNSSLGHFHRAEAFGNEIGGHEIDNEGTIRITYSNPVPARAR